MSIAESPILICPGHIVKPRLNGIRLWHERTSEGVTNGIDDWVVERMLVIAIDSSFDLAFVLVDGMKMGYVSASQIVRVF